MEEKALLKLCLICSVIGIASLFLINKAIQPSKIEISQLQEGMNHVKVFGEIESKYFSKTGTTFLRVKDRSGTIKAVTFKGISTDSIQKGDFVEIVGDVQRYKGELEIIVRKIKKL